MTQVFGKPTKRMSHLIMLILGALLGKSSRSVSSNLPGCVAGDFNIAFSLFTNSQLTTYRFSTIYFPTWIIAQINEDPSMIFHQNNWTLGYAMLTAGNMIQSFHQFSRLRPAWSSVYQSLLESNFTFCTTAPREDGRNHLFYVQGALALHGSSTVSLISSYLQYNQLPLIGPVSSADALGNKVKHPFFARMVAGDEYQAQTVLELVLKFRWRYLMVIYDSGAYGTGLARKFASLLYKQTKGLSESFCITMQRPYGTGSYDFKTIVNEVEKYVNKTRIVVFFSFWYTDLMTALRPFELVYVFTDGVDSPRASSLNQTIGSFFIGFTYAKVEDQFVTDFNAITNVTALTIPFGKKFWETTFQCCYDNCNKSCSSHPVLNDTMKMKDTSRLGLYARLGAGIIALARAISDAALGPTCRNFSIARNLSAVTQCVDGKAIYAALLKQNFTRFNLPVSFLANGDARPQYRIRQQVNRTDSIEMREVGTWDFKTGLQLNQQLLSWRSGIIPEAFCSAPCQPGEYKRLVDSECCWVCERCRNNEIERNKTCLPCPLHFWPVQSLCVALKPEFKSWNESPAVINFVLACFGLIIVIITIAIYILRKSEPLLKASAIELSLMVLSGLVLSYVTILLSFHGYPTTLLCMVRLLGYGVSLSLSYSCLLVKTIRIFRVFASATKGTARPRFVSTHSVLLTASTLWVCQVSFENIQNFLYRLYCRTTQCNNDLYSV